MASVFLSYVREDEAKARAIAAALENAGHEVWWDRHIKGGSQYAKEIERALKAADAVVVLWSEQSVDSAWVRDEAASGRDRGRLVPVSLDGTEPPLGFRQYQTIVIHGARLSRASTEALLSAVAAVAGQPETGSPKLPVRRPPRRALAVAAAAAILVLAALFVWKPWTGRSAVPVVAVAAQSASSNELARDLLTKLGNLQASRIHGLKLVDGGTETAADLFLEVDGSSDDQTTRANLVLMGGKQRGLLWSKAFEQPVAKRADMQQQLAYTAAKVIECAVEGMAARKPRLGEDTLKLYLNGCSAHAELAGTGSRGLINLFRQVVEKAPRFEPGWAKLIQTESEAVSDTTLDQTQTMLEPLRRHMEEARRLNPDMPELLLAEADLVPPIQYGQRIRLIERAVERNPASSLALASYSTALMAVGRGDESIIQARRAVELDPLSPFLRDALISALTYAGQTESALASLRDAEKLWPGATNLLGASYRLHLRYGDPRVALRMHRLGGFGGEIRDSFLEARLDPSPAKIERAIASPRRLFRQYPEAFAELAQVLGAFGREEELIPILLNWRHPDKVHWVTDVLFRPSLSEMHHDPRMIAVAKRLGLLDYWQASGKWPDFCFEPGLPYDCKTEAAKISR